MATIKSPGLVLQRIAFGETSLILKVYTAERGLITLMAKGARGSKSKWRALTDFFLLVQWVFPGHGRGDMVVLQDASLVEDLPSLRQTPLKQALAQVWLETYLRFSPGNDESFQRFDWLLQHLQSLDRSLVPYEATLLSVDFLLGLCSLNGFALQFRECVHCGESMQPERMRLSLDLGGPVCSRCEREEGATEVLSWDAIRLMERAQWFGLDAMLGATSTSQLAEKYLLAYFQRHLGEGRTLRALKVYRDLAPNAHNAKS
jgi:DNA repair protein RecO (recombination protein O)